MKIECDAVIFDVDGTLAETEELHRAAFNHTFSKWKLDWHWDKNLYGQLLRVSGGKERLHYYKRLRSSVNASLGEHAIASIHRNKTMTYAQFLRSRKLDLKPGVANLIKQAQSKRIKVSIATATSLQNVNSVVENIWRRPVSKIFDAVATGDEVSNKKPSPEVYELILNKLQMRAEHCIAIEDSLNGLKAAKGAGIRTIVIPSLYTRHEDFSLADLVLTSLVKLRLK